MFRAAIIFVLVLMSIRLSHSSYAGLSFQLSRKANDIFKNPTATQCNSEPSNRKFCEDTNSRCDGNCCQCICDNPKSTFDTTTMKCRNNTEIRAGCNTMFKNLYTNFQIKPLDLKKKDDKQKIQLPNLQWNDYDKAKSCFIDNITWYHNGSKTTDQFITVNGRPGDKRGENGEVTIKWENNVPKMYYGKMFRVHISYTFETGKGPNKKTTSKEDCFVFKSSGITTVTFPSLPSSSPPTDKSTSTTTLPSSSTTSSTGDHSSTKPTGKSTSTTVVSSTSTEDHSSTKPTGKSTSTAVVSSTSTEERVSTKRTEKSTVFVSTKDFSTPRTRTPKPSVEVSTTETVGEPSGYSPTPGARESSGDGGSNAVVVSLVVVIACLVLLIAVVLVVIWSRKRAANASKDKNGGTVIANKSANNPMMMSTMPENIYAEADNPVNYSSEKGKDSFVYDYAVGNLDNNYTSLDKNKVEIKPAYQSLNKVQNDIYEQIPAEKEIPKSEPLYHVVDETDNQHTSEELGSYERLAGGREIPGRTGNENPERVYSILEDESVPEHYGREAPGRTDDDNPERVCSVLEDEGENVVPEHFGRDVPGRTGNENPENVYSVLEDETAESDYLTVLPERSEYEQPINPPVSDA